MRILANHICENMKNIFFKSAIKPFVLALLLAGLPAFGQVTLTSSWTGAQMIPDNDASGVAFNFNLSDAATVIENVSITLNLSGGYNGDLYAYLSHGEGFSVLLNRVGRTDTSDFGTSTPGMLVTLTSGATADIHNYQALSPSYNGSGQLTGTWAADGRGVKPTLAFDTTSRTATLDAFTGSNPNGDWTLFLCDNSSGGIATLNGWSVGVTAVPEPQQTTLVIGIALLGLGCFRIRQNQKKRA
jgi:subtilisin-like proprotein convertase family protein